jgi:glycosyltransferase involved in cell wall biosynthesis
MTESREKSASVSAIVPARNEEAAITASVESLAGQPEIAEILVVNDQSKDATAEVVRGLTQRFPKLKLLETGELPADWVGKNNAVWLGAREATGEWLLFTDADAVHRSNSVEHALRTASENHAEMVSFSPEQTMKTWYEKALIPYVYCRLGSRFSYAEVNDPQKSAAAANGQFLMIRREVYDAVGGHASIAGEVLEDVALAKRVKGAGNRIWFGSGREIVRTRMYRSFGAMWEGWKKNLYLLMGGCEEALGKEIARAAGPLLAAVVAAISTWGLTENGLTSLAVLAVGLLAVFVAYDDELRRNQFSHRLVGYGLLGRLLFAGVLWASYRSHKQGKLKWKGREYPVGTPRASKG